jgi:hypothetical protein
LACGRVYRILVTAAALLIVYAVYDVDGTEFPWTREVAAT